MRRNVRVVLVGLCLAAAVLLVAGCTVGRGTAVEISGGSAQFNKGDLEVKLDANPTTGYEWTYEIDGTVVKADGDEYVTSSDGAQPRTGQGGVHTFKFKADGSGEATITFTYARSWESTSSDKTLVLHVTVDNDAFTQVKEQA